MSSQSQNEREIQRWMEAIASRKRPAKKLVFDKKTKKLVAVSSSDPSADKSLEFTPQEATRFL